MDCFLGIEVDDRKTAILLPSVKYSVVQVSILFALFFFVTYVNMYLSDITQ